MVCLVGKPSFFLCKLAAAHAAAASKQAGRCQLSLKISFLVHKFVLGSPFLLTTQVSRHSSIQAINRIQIHTSNHIARSNGIRSLNRRRLRCPFLCAWSIHNPCYHLSWIWSLFPFFRTTKFIGCPEAANWRE